MAEILMQEKKVHTVITLAKGSNHCIGLSLASHLTWHSMVYSKDIVPKSATINYLLPSECSKLPQNAGKLLPGSEAPHPTRQTLSSKPQFPLHNKHTAFLLQTLSG